MLIHKPHKDTKTIFKTEENAAYFYKNEIKVLSSEQVRKKWGGNASDIAKPLVFAKAVIGQF